PGTPGGRHWIPVPRSSGRVSTRNFSAPGAGCTAPTSRTPFSAMYRPDRSGLPFASFGTGGGARGGAAGSAAAVVPRTVTVTARRISPLLPVAVSVYVVVAAGVTRCVPRNATLPGSGAIDTVYAFNTSQCNVAAWPGSIAAGSAFRSRINAGAPRGAAP